ncbi:DNA methyltransferase [Sediminibacterium goheungense]|uniref:Putative DNA methylase n=1 Tax=Sediminibacterium goheungense TaxID=1086393 RepID=A0A4R6J2C0_9BACT|nr:DNA methyltransferase [Sediminibacterium goheungense]TDO28416.1 putative DNA methylase [Sediminibacterium goheungense]
MSKTIIEDDSFPFEVISKIAEKESWRKDINRPIYHLHKWWAKRLGSVFRAILLGCVLDKEENLMDKFYSSNQYKDQVVADLFMGSGTTIGEAAKLGMTSFGCDINPVAVESVRVALTPFNEERLEVEFKKLAAKVSAYLLQFYKSKDSKDIICDVLYYFWVMQSICKKCNTRNDLFTDYILSKDAYPQRKPKINVICPKCNEIFIENYEKKDTICPSCKYEFVFRKGNSKGSTFICSMCNSEQKILENIKGEIPAFRLFAKLIIDSDGNKQYLKCNDYDLQMYDQAVEELTDLLESNQIKIPDLNLEKGYNTTQAIKYGFKNWSDFFNPRQLLLLGKLQKEISTIDDEIIRDIFSMIFSSILEFNNRFASYKGEGTGAVRHMFSNHVLKPEKRPIEANLWGTTRSSGSFSGIFRNRLKRIINYKNNPKEVHLTSNHNAKYSLNNILVRNWDTEEIRFDGAVYLRSGDSSSLPLENGSVDFVITDPPFFDNVQYSELADFFYSWLRLYPHGFILNDRETTRNKLEVQDTDSVTFSKKLENVFKEGNRILKPDGLLVFTYHHSRNEGWISIAHSIEKAGFYVINTHPIKAEMSVAAPKQQAKEPIQLDIIIVCGKILDNENRSFSISDAEKKAELKAKRMESQGFTLTENDKKVILQGELLKTDYFLKSETPWV